MKPCIAAFLLLAASSAAFAQADDPWEIEWKSQKPAIFTYRNPVGDLENYWYVTYTLSNATDRILPLTTDVQLYTEGGKDLLHDVRKVDPTVTGAVDTEPETSEKNLYGRFYSDVIIPRDVEYKIIAHIAGLENRSPGIMEESIENLKKGNEEQQIAPQYLNAREVRQSRVLLPGRSLSGIAIFRNVSPASRRLEVQVSGLQDVIRTDNITETEFTLSYQNVVLKIRYDFKGDEFGREADRVDEVGREWVTKHIGPIASKETLGNLLNGLVEAYTREREWKEAAKTEEEISALRATHKLLPSDFNIMARALRQATGVNFGYDESKDLLGNEKAIWRMHEWWTTNASKLAYDPALNRFVVEDDALPGAVDKDPH